MVDESENTDSEFRKAERQLDEAMHRDREAMVSSGIELFNDSGDSYYKTSFLAWSLRFESRCARGNEVEKVWGRVFVCEAEPTLVKIWRRAGIFSIGARSDWEETVEREVSLEALLRHGLAATVLEEVEKGKAAAGGAG